MGVTMDIAGITESKYAGIIESIDHAIGIALKNPDWDRSYDYTYYKVRDEIKEEQCGKLVVVDVHEKGPCIEIGDFRVVRTQRAVQVRRNDSEGKSIESFTIFDGKCVAPDGVFFPKKMYQKFKKAAGLE